MQSWFQRPEARVCAASSLAAPEDTGLLGDRNETRERLLFCQSRRRPGRFVRTTCWAREKLLGPQRGARGRRVAAGSHAASGAEPGGAAAHVSGAGPQPGSCPAGCTVAPPCQPRPDPPASVPRGVPDSGCSRECHPPPSRPHPRTLRSQLRSHLRS